MTTLSKTINLTSKFKKKSGLPSIICCSDFCNVFCCDPTRIVFDFVVVNQTLRTLAAQASQQYCYCACCDAGCYQSAVPRNSFAPLRCKDWQLVVLIAIFPTNSRNLEREKPLKNASNCNGNVMWKFRVSITNCNSQISCQKIENCDDECLRRKQ